jgi:hypothetical protein
LNTASRLIGNEMSWRESADAGYSGAVFASSVSFSAKPMA